MQRLLTGLLTAIAVLSIGAAGLAMAGSKVGRHWESTGGNGNGGSFGGACHYVDADGNGLCDNCNEACHYLDADGDGVCDGCGGYYHYRSGGSGTEYGVCDPQDVRGHHGRGYGQGRGHCGHHR